MFIYVCIFDMLICLYIFPLPFFLMSHEIGVCLTDRSSSKRRFTNIRYQKHSQRPHPACHMQADRDLETNQVDG